MKDTSIAYNDEETIPESNIESYFVWIPKYSYQLWDLGDYSALSTLTTKEQEIKIKFGIANTSDSKTGECASPQVAGETGNCEVGEYMTHPAFLAFDTNGFWVGKFETGYDEATSTSSAQSNTTNVDKVIIKPNVYSWSNVKVGFAFQTSYEYLREEESHMMKNTEWGATTYLHHSIYGSQVSLRVNNNSNYITGYAAVEEPTKGYKGSSVAGNRYQGTTLGEDKDYTINYLNSGSVVASTTGNITGIYDIAGGLWDYVAGYTTGASTKGGSSGITGIYSDFLTNVKWEKYYDKYSATGVRNYNNRILGDATGEVGPFQNKTDPDNTARTRSSWYADQGHFITSANPWFIRGGRSMHGIIGGAYTFYYETGANSTSRGYRIVLSPATEDETVSINKILVNNNVADVSNEYDYLIKVENDITSATIKIETTNPNATVEIIDQDGVSTLGERNNLYTIRVTSANGRVTKDYVLNVYRKIIPVGVIKFTNGTRAEEIKVVGTAYYYWQNNTGRTVNLSYNIYNSINDETGNTASGCYLGRNTKASSSGMSTLAEIKETTKTGKVSIPDGYYFVLFNQNNAYTFVHYIKEVGD